MALNNVWAIVFLPAILAIVDVYAMPHAFSLRSGRAASRGPGGN
jgi:hypothetical protein